MKKITILFISFVFLLSACAPQTNETPAISGEPQAVTVMTHDSFAVSEDVVKAFEDANNAKVTFLQSGDAGEMLNKAILTKGAPLADVLYGVDNTFLSRALEAGIFESYASPELSNIPDAFKLDASNNALPVDYGDVCINYDKKYFADNSLAVPGSLEDLTKPEFANLLVTENPATSSTGLAFMLATVAHFSECGCCRWLGNRLLHQLQRFIGSGTSTDGCFLWIITCCRSDLRRDPARRCTHRFHPWT